MARTRCALCVSKMKLRYLTGFLVLAAAISFAGPETESFGPGQAIADEIRSAAGADAAFVPAGVLNENAKGDLASYLQFPGDQIAVVKLTGAQIKAALERSVSLYPSPNPSFLQISGLDVNFKKSAEAESRVTSVTINGSALEMGSSYEVAMPNSLARGGLGYFTIWKKEAVVRTLPGTTLESLLKGKSGNVKETRWHAGE